MPQEVRARYGIGDVLEFTKPTPQGGYGGRVYPVGKQMQVAQINITVEACCGELSQSVNYELCEAGKEAYLVFSADEETISSCMRLIGNKPLVPIRTRGRS